MNSTKKLLEDSDSVLLLGSFVAKNPNTRGKFQHCFVSTKKYKFPANSTDCFFVSLAIFYKLFAYHISFTFIFWLANFSDRLIKNTLSRLFAVSGLQ